MVIQYISYLLRRIRRNNKDRLIIPNRECNYWKYFIQNKAILMAITFPTFIPFIDAQRIDTNWLHFIGDIFYCYLLLIEFIQANGSTTLAQ